MPDVLRSFLQFQNPRLANVSKKRWIKTASQKDPQCQNLVSKFDAWKYPGEGLPGKSRCGLCGVVFTKWQERNNHIADHFNNGKTMEDWRGDWGLSQRWMQRLSKATPTLPALANLNSPNAVMAPYECTFCLKTFSAVGEWSLHENTHFRIAGRYNVPF